MGVLMAVAFWDGAEVARRLPVRGLIDAMSKAFLMPPSAPVRQRIDSTFSREILLMPSVGEAFAGVKILTIMPDNRNLDLPVIQGIFTLFDFRNGMPLISMDADELTARRTAAISAIAARQLVREDAESLLLVGSGHLIPFLAQAHTQVREYSSIKLWARNPEKAAHTIAKIADFSGRTVEFAPDLNGAAREADVISCATRSKTPVICGRWLKPGTHLDLVGGYRPDMREVDDEAVCGAKIYVDTRAGALAEAGDLLDPISRGIISADDIAGDITDLTKGDGRSSLAETTIFKTVGSAASDLVAAEFAWTAA